MKKLSLLIFISVGGYAGWRLGASFGSMTAYFISLMGSLAGVVVGCIFNRKYLDL